MEESSDVRIPTVSGSLELDGYLGNFGLLSPLAQLIRSHCMSHFQTDV